MKCSHQPRPCLSGQCPPGQQLRRLANARTGFALVVTLAMMVLLIVVAVGLLGLSTISIKVSTLGSAQDRARANAHMALMIALGQLQESAGPDRRISGSGKLAGGLPQNPHWTGIWSSNPDDMLPVWLVSGNEGYGLEQLNAADDYPEAYFTPGQQPDDNWFSFHSSTLPGESVSAPTVPIMENGAITGRYAWWVSDEGTKARVDVTAPSTAPANDAEQIARSISPQENGIRQVNPLFDRLAAMTSPTPLDKIDKRRILSHNTLDLLGNGDGQALSRQYFHDLTTGGYGLPVNVVTGGMKTDLSIAFDSSQSTRGYDAKIIGATPVLVTGGGYAGVFNFSPVSEPNTFYLIPELSNNGSFAAGPNWGTLYNYCKLWKNVDTSIKRITPLSIPTNKPFNEYTVDSDLRTNTWAPYRRHAGVTGRRDSQHTNSAVNPVLSMVQIGFRLASIRKGQSPNYTYDLELQFKPVIGVWNPYNIRITPSHIGLRWGLYPYIKLGVETPDGTQHEYIKYLREDLPKGGEGDKIWQLSTSSTIDLQPGEIRLLSVGRKNSGDLYNFGETSRLVNKWDQNGYFKAPITVRDAAGNAVDLPEGSKVWCSELVLLDVQKPETWDEIKDEFSPGSPWIADGNSASFFALSVDGDDVHRITDFWQTPTSTVRDDLPYLVPEPIPADASPLKMPVESIRFSQNAASYTPLEIGTWRFFTRNAYDAANTQKLRGWVDTNPRFALSNPLWDGSLPVGTEGYQGWQFPSAFIGDTSSLDPIDHGPTGRGRVIGPPEPEATLTDDRYQGYGGFTSKTSGQTHVPVFDVPRGPLVSLGQLQHAQFSRYQYEPALPFGNSYASTRIPPEKTKAEKYMEMENFTMHDISYGLNDALWDNYFFSTIGRDYIAPDSTAPLDSVLDFTQLAAGSQTLPNPRYTLRPQPGDSTFQEILETAGENGPNALAARIHIEGAFNVNSTSVEAWKAVLSSMADFKFPVISTDGSSVSWADPMGIRLPRFGHVLAENGWSDGDGPLSKEFWQGYRKLSGTELDSLASEIVNEVRERGPFRSFADFVNRDPDSTDINHQRKGALQAALDRAINSSLNDDDEIGPGVTTPPVGSQFSQVQDEESQAAGFAGYLMQGDVLQSLAPVMQVRSDTFRIRAMGQSLDASGNVLARATCEALIQRNVDYVDPVNTPETRPDNLTSTANQRFGRRFEIVSFRWLATNEL